MKKRVGYWLLINAIVLVSVICFFLGVGLLRSLGLTGCSFYENMHLYCPGCGGTRALESLLHFDIISSLKYNAILLPGIILFVYYDLRSLLALWLCDDKYFLENKYIPVLAYVIFTVLHFIVRNALLVCGIDLMLL